MTRRVAVEFIAILAAAGALAGFGTAQLLPRQFTSQETVGLANSVSDAKFEQAKAETMSTASLSQIIAQSSSYRADLDFTPLDDIVERIRANSAITHAHDGFHVEFRDPDRNVASETAHALIESVARNAGTPTRGVETVHVGLTGPSAGICTLTGMGIGILLGVFVIRLARVHSRRL